MSDRPWYDPTGLPLDGGVIGEWRADTGGLLVRDCWPEEGEIWCAYGEFGRWCVDEAFYAMPRVCPTREAADRALLRAALAEAERDGRLRMVGELTVMRVETPGTGGQQFRAWTREQYDEIMAGPGKEHWPGATEQDAAPAVQAPKLPPGAVWRRAAACDDWWSEWGEGGPKAILAPPNEGRWWLVRAADGAPLPYAEGPITGDKRADMEAAALALWRAVRPPVGARVRATGEWAWLAKKEPGEGVVTSWLSNGVAAVRFGGDCHYNCRWPGCKAENPWAQEIEPVEAPATTAPGPEGGGGSAPEACVAAPEVPVPPAVQPPWRPTYLTDREVGNIINEVVRTLGGREGRHVKTGARVALRLADDLCAEARTCSPLSEQWDGLWRRATQSLGSVLLSRADWRHARDLRRAMEEGW